MTGLGDLGLLDAADHAFAAALQEALEAGLVAALHHHFPGYASKEGRNPY